MKKYAKLLGIAIAGVGVVGSFAVGYSLYVNQPEAQTIKIGATVDTTADINYSIGAITKTFRKSDNTDVTATAVSPVACKYHVEVPLGADPKTDHTLQPNVVGKVSVALTGDAITNGTVSGEVSFTGFEAGKWGENNANELLHYWTKDEPENPDSTWTEHHDEILNKDNPSRTYDRLVVSTNKSQKLVIDLVFDVGTEEKMIAAAAEDLNIAINWGVETSYNYPYVYGEFCSWSPIENYEYRMVPNIAANSFEWMYHGFSVTNDSDIKARFIDGDVSGGSNYNAKSGKTYNMYWGGSSENDLIVQEQPAS